MSSCLLPIEKAPVQCCKSQVLLSKGSVSVLKCELCELPNNITLIRLVCDFAECKDAPTPHPLSLGTVNKKRSFCFPVSVFLCMGLFSNDSTQRKGNLTHATCIHLSQISGLPVSHHQLSVHSIHLKFSFGNADKNHIAVTTTIVDGLARPGKGTI